MAKACFTAHAEGAEGEGSVERGMLSAKLQRREVSTAFSWLRSSAISDSFTGAVPNIFWGGGKLDALAAMGLNPPKGPVLTATKKSSSEIQLDWTIEPAATSFLIERKIGEGGVFQPIYTVTGATTYIDGGLIKDTLYTYRVTAFFNQLSSSQSNEASAIPMG